MKKMIITIFLTGLMVVYSYSQRFEFSALGAYQFGGAVDETTQEGGEFTYGEALGISGSQSFGIVFGYRLLPKMKLEISLDRQPTQLNHHQVVEGTEDREVTKLSDVDVDYYMVGLIYDWSTTKTRPFIGASLGMLQMTPEGEFKTESHPAFAPVIGINTFASSHFAFRLQARFLLSQMPEGSLFYDEYSHHKETYMSQYQFGFGATLAF